MGNRTLIRPDGSEVRVDDADAGQLLTLGYKEKSGAQVYGESVNQGEEEHYSTPLQKYLTFYEGANSGGSLGISDTIFGTEGSANRARFHPGIRLGGEIAGTIAASMEGVPSPVRGLTEVAELGGEALGGGSKVVSSIARGSIEGAGFGAGQAVTTAKLDGDPLTAQAVLAGMGQGALWGGALSGIGEGVAGQLEKRAARAAEEKLALTAEEKLAQTTFESTKARYDAQIEETLGMRDRHAAMKAVEDEHFVGLNNSIRDAAETLNDTINQANKEVERAKMDFTGVKMSNKKIQADLVERHLMVAARTEARGMESTLAKAQLFAEKGDYEAMQAQLEKFQEHSVVMEAKLGGKQYFNSEKVVGQAEKLIGEAKMRVDTAAQGAKTMAEARAVHAALSGFPRTATEFASMQASKIERLAAAVDKLQGLKVGELEGVKQSVADAIDRLGQGLGVTMEGTPGQKMAGMWKAAKEANGARSRAAREAMKEGNLLWKKTEKSWNAVDAERAASKSTAKGRGSRFIGYAGGALVGKELGMGYPGYILGRQLVQAMMGVKGAVLGHLGDVAGKYLPKSMRVLEKVGPRLEPLAQRLDGSIEESKKSRRELMETRMREINEAAPAMRDTLYKSVSPLTIEHPEFAAALHDTAVSRFQFLMSKMPKDPGNAYSKLQSTWKADPVDIEKFSRYYAAFHDPVGVLTRAMNTGKITMEEADGVANMDPELWQVWRQRIIERVSDPEIMKNVGYHDQIHLGMITGINFHASMAPHFIAATQQMYTERNKPLEMNPRVQPGGGAGRPSGPGPSATSAQRVTEH